MTDVAAPDLTEWWDAVATKDAVMARLRLQSDGSDLDDARVEALIPAAGRLLNARMDRVTPVDPELDLEVPPQALLEDVVIAMYQPPTFDLSGNPVDPIAAVELTPYRQRWGVA